MERVPKQIRQQKKKFCYKLFILVALINLPLLPNSALAQDELEIHGFISQGYLKSTGSNYLAKTKHGSWEFAEVGINFGTNVSNEMRIGIQLFARDLGDLGNFNFEFDWGFADYSWLDALSFRMGRIKMPYGLYGEYRDLDLVRPSVLMPQSVYFEALRDLQVAFDGIQLYGSIDTEELGLGSFDYSLWAGSMMGPGTGAKSSTALFFNNRAFSQGQGQQIFVARDDAVTPYMGGYALTWNTPMDGLLLKNTLVYYRAKINADLNPDFIKDLERIDNLPEYLDPIQTYWTDVLFSVSSLEYTYDEFVLAAEYSRYIGEFRSLNAPLIPHSDLNQERYYIQGSYRFNDLIQLSAYYGYQRDPRVIYRAFPDLLLGRKQEDAVLPQGSKRLANFQEDYSTAIRFDLNDYWILKFEGHLMHGYAIIYEVLNPNNPQGQKWWYLMAAKTTLAF